MTLTAILIGNESLTVQCGEMWMDRGHQLAFVATHSADVRAWAVGAGLAVGGLADVPMAPVDWLLSIANLTVIPDAMLSRAGGGGEFSRRSLATPCGAERAGLGFAGGRSAAWGDVAPD